MQTLVSCPDCGVPAEITERFRLVADEAAAIGRAGTAAVRDKDPSVTGRGSELRGRPLVMIALLLERLTV